MTPFSDPKPSPDELWNRLLAGEDDPVDAAPITSADINAQTLARMAVEVPVRQVRFRLSGKAVQAHRVSVKIAANALASLQEVVSSIGAALSGSATLFGQIAQDVRKSTELSLSPVFMPGSVVFTLRPEDVDDNQEQLFAAVEVPTLLDQSLSQLVVFLHRLSQDDLGDDLLVADVRRLGPRAAKHLNELSELVLGDDVVLGVDWDDGTGRRAHGSLNTRSAAYLSDLIKRNRIDVDERRLTGTLITVSTEDPAALRLEDGTRVSLRVDTATAPAIGEYFDRRVVVTVAVQTTRSTSTGKEVQQYTLLAIEAAPLEPQLP